MEAIENGDFASGELSPGWSICSDDFEGAVDNEHPHRPLFITEYNLRMRGNDCVRQQWSTPIWVRGDLTFRAKIERFSESGHNFSESEAGDLFVRTVYEDSTYDTMALNAAELGEGRPTHFFYDCSVPVRTDRRLCSISLFLRDCPNYWYLTFFSLEEGLSLPPMGRRPSKNDLTPIPQQSLEQALRTVLMDETLSSFVSESLAHRFSRLEKQVTGLTQFIADRYCSELKPDVPNRKKDF